jgi:hypothetical protein
MKKILAGVLVCFAVILSCETLVAQNAQNAAVAQKSGLRISDINPVTDIDSAMSSAGKIRLTVNFKMNDPSLADSVFFMFGNTSGGHEIAIENGKFQKSGKNISVKTQGGDFALMNKEASCKVKVSKEAYNSSKYLSIVVKDNSGQYTNVLSIRIN